MLNIYNKGLITPPFNSICKKLAKRALWLKNRFQKIVRTAIRLRALIPRNLPFTAIGPLTEKYFYLIFLVVAPIIAGVCKLNY